MNNDPTTLTKILSSINNTLNIANKAMPLYKEAKPILKTINNTYKNIKTNKNDLSSIIKLMKLKNTIKNDMNQHQNNMLPISNNNQKTITNTTYSNINNPTFFI